LKHGQGEYKWASGNVYRGGYRFDKRHGYGEMFWVDGSVYKGYWVDGIQHGYGIMIMANGEEKEGLFEHGVFKRFGTKEEIESLMGSKKSSSLKSDYNQQTKAGKKQK